MFFSFFLLASIIIVGGTPGIQLESYLDLCFAVLLVNS